MYRLACRKSGKKLVSMHAGKADQHAGKARKLGKTCRKIRRKSCMHNVNLCRLFSVGASGPLRKKL